MSGKYALIIGNTEYSDPGLAQLMAPGKDADDFARILKDPEICAFDDVKILLNQPEHDARGAIDEFFDQKKPDDLLVLYFSGHGVRDEIGSLYLAVKNTIRNRLRSTAIKSDYVREAMDQSRSRRQVLILDCCNSGAFEQGTKAATGVSIGTATAFEAGYGRIVLTASDSTQFAWEGNRVIGETANSLFTHFLVEGLKGEADLDGDGRITVDELYDYAYERVKVSTPKQTPSKFSSKQQGEIVLRQSIRTEDIKSVPLPTPLVDSIENPFPDIRMGAVQQLIKLLHGKNIGMARSAREALERIAENDDSRQVSRAATQALESSRRGGQQTIPSEAEEPQHTRSQKEESLELKTDEPTSLSSTQVSRAATQAPGVPDQRDETIFQKEIVTPPPSPVNTVERSELESDHSINLPNPQASIVLGWAFAGIIGGSMYHSVSEGYAGVIGGAIGGAIGGLFTAFAFRNGQPSSKNSAVWVAAAWAVGLAVGWHIGDKIITETTGMTISYAIGAMISLGILLAMGLVSANWKSLGWTVIGWGIGGGLGWFIAKKLMIESFNMGWGTSWTTGMGIGWTIAGLVMGWQLLNPKGR